MSKEQDIVEGNKLIAEFMQLRKLTENTWINPVTSSSTNELFYHQSWGWLMPVIEKIADFHWPDYYGTRGKDAEQDGDWDDCAYPRTFGMRDKEGNFMVRINASQLFTSPYLKEATWLAVVDFIQWYQQNQKPQ